MPPVLHGLTSEFAHGRAFSEVVAVTNPAAGAGFTYTVGSAYWERIAAVSFTLVSDGNAANLNNLPILQAGGCGDYFKTGWAINVEGANATMSPGNSSKDCANGQSPINSLDSVGTPSNTATMPINKYFCTLLNGLGAQADASGYATPGATGGKVTKFGKYDNTQYFADGGTKASVIEKPGEYAELLA